MEQRKDKLPPDSDLFDGSSCVTMFQLRGNLKEYLCKRDDGKKRQLCRTDSDMIVTENMPSMS